VRNPQSEHHGRGAGEDEHARRNAQPDDARPQPAAPRWHLGFLRRAPLDGAKDRPIHEVGRRFFRQLQLRQGARDSARRFELGGQFLIALAIGQKPRSLIRLELAVDEAPHALAGSHASSSASRSLARARTTRILSAVMGLPVIAFISA
jgi:hypothetical protein